MRRKHLVVLSGAGISAESGLRTFRDSDGLWEGYQVTEVATPEAWQRDRETVLRFYDERRRDVLAASPNAAHQLFAEAEQWFRVTVITQNIDNLHERAGSGTVVHLHGEITKARSSIDEHRVYPIEGWQLSRTARCEAGSPLRPHIVWFGEAVPMMEHAAQVARDADIFVVIGTSLVVYPAASLIHYVPPFSRRFLVDPVIPAGADLEGYTLIRQGAVAGSVQLRAYLTALAED